MVFASVGNISFKKLVYLLEKHFGAHTITGSGNSRKNFANYKPTAKIEEKGSFLSHLMIGNIAYSRMDERRLPLLLLNNILGGPALNSRLNLSLREKYGYAYSIESMYQPYSDTGMFAIYLGTDNRNIDKSIKVVKRELKNLRENSLGTAQFSRAKKQLAGQLAIQFESRQNEMLAVAKSHLYRPEVKSLAGFLSEIENLNANSLMEVANEVLDEKQLSMLIFEGKENE
jgi:predicted Zn-dependent peptidase